MDENILKRCCPNCSQPYRLKSLLPGQKQNFPLFLKCGHSICETCVRNIIKFLEPIDCKICHEDMELDNLNVKDLMNDKSKFFEVFPLNQTLVGELAFQLIEHGDSIAQESEGSHFIDLQSILLDIDSIQGNCLECNKPTTKNCRQCATTLCENCFTKSHKNFVIFKTHILQSIEPHMDLNNCNIHKEKTLDYYCKTCTKAICMDCMMVGGDKSCKNHDVAPMQEMNENFSEELSDLSPKVVDIFKRLTKTAVDIGYMLYNLDNESGSSSDLAQVVTGIEQHFSKLFASIQKHRHEVIKLIKNIKSCEKESLTKAKNDTADYIKKANQVIKAINICSDPNKLKQVNLCMLLEKAKEILEAPWYLKKEETDKHPLKITVNEDLCALVSDYIHLEGSASPMFKLYPNSELEGIELPPPPNSAVYPPDLQKDVRQKQSKPKKVADNSKEIQKVPTSFQVSAPKYRTKSASVSSLNSNETDSSYKSYLTTNEGNQKPVVHPVMPFKDAQGPKPLVEGSQELIYVSHIIDPHNFYVQRASHQEVVKEMVREFRNSVSLPKPSAKHTSEGKVYLAFNKADNMWQRCRIVSIDKSNINNPLYNVFYIDFGSSDVLTIENLRLLPPQRVHTPYPLAINCSLANCVPIRGAWTQDDSLLIQKIINNRQAVIYIRQVKATSNYSMMLQVDVTTFEDGVCLTRALVFHERARLINPKLKYPTILGMIEKPKIFTNHNDYKFKGVEDVFITHVQSPDKFFVRKSYLQEVYNKLSEDLEQEYSLNDHSQSVYLPEIGMVYVVFVEKGGEGGVGGEGGEGWWARCAVAEAPGRGRVRVALLDRGGALLAHWRHLRHIRHRFTTIRALATECYLAGVTPLNNKWNPNSVLLLQQYQERLLELHVENNKNRDSLGVTLYDKNDEENIICINNEMIKNRFAISFGMYKFNKDFAVAPQVITNKCPIDEPIKAPKRKINILKKQSPTIIKESDLEAKDKGPLRLEAKILHYQSPSLIYISLVHQRKIFNELFENIQKYYSKIKASVKENNWAIGDRCCTFYKESETWRRAVILEIENENAKVFYTDFAIVESVPLNSLQELTAEFASVGDAAIKCHLCSVIPAVGDEWPSLTKEYLKELLDAYNRVFITKGGNFKDKSMPIEIWVYHTIQGSALEPNISEWRCLNKKIIEQGLGIPDKNQEVDNAASNGNNLSDDTLSFLNVTGSVRDWLQLEPAGTAKFIESKSDEQSNRSTPVDFETSSDKSLSNVKFISDWLPPEPLSCKEFTGMPTYIDNDGIIYLHDICQQDTLDLIRKALEVRFKQPDPKAKFVTWTVGEPCIALYFLDNRFYRGRVLEVDNENKNCLIHYVDYGNEDVCSFENLRKTIALHQIPIQAHRCVLNRIAPIDLQWDRQTLDYIHKSIVEKQCLIKVTGDPVDDAVPIELKYDKLWINDHLVEFEMAKYKDGSKAVIHKYAPTYIDEDLLNNSDSGPDYIIEESKSEESFNIENLKNKDWNLLIDEEDETGLGGNKLRTYTDFSEQEFVCNILVIHDMNSFELSIIPDDGTAKLYEDMFTELQMEGENMPPLNGFTENKPCIALFKEDNQWYRACILQYCEEKNQIKVRYVDYGNIGIISVAEAREITEEWTVLPPGTITARVHGIQINPEIETDVLKAEYANTFLDKGPFHATIIEYENSIPYVELKNNEGNVVYQNLIDTNIFTKNGSISVN